MSISLNINTSSLIRSNTVSQQRRLTSDSRITTDVAVTKEYNLNNDCVTKIQFSDADLNTKIINLRNNSLGATDTERPLQNISLLQSLERIDISGNNMSTLQINNFVDDLYNSAQINSLRGVIYNISGNSTPDVDQQAKLQILQDDYGFTDINTISISYNHSIPTIITLNIQGGIGDNITINWGDGSSETQVLTGWLDTYNHSYAAGTFTAIITNEIGNIIQITTGVDNITVLNLKGASALNTAGVSGNTTLTTIVMPEVNVIQTLNLQVCAISDSDSVVVAIDDNGQINGTLLIEGGTNAALTATGLAAKANLITKGWGVTNN